MSAYPEALSSVAVYLDQQKARICPKMLFAGFPLIVIIFMWKIRKTMQKYVKGEINFNVTRVLLKNIALKNFFTVFIVSVVHLGLTTTTFLLNLLGVARIIFLKLQALYNV